MLSHLSLCLVVVVVGHCLLLFSEYTLEGFRPLSLTLSLSSLYLFVVEVMNMVGSVTGTETQE